MWSLGKGPSLYPVLRSSHITVTPRHVGDNEASADSETTSKLSWCGSTRFGNVGGAGIRLESGAVGGIGSLRV